jgi:phosphoglycolate phosphatase-like HAD superfamily hydrolase
MFDESTSWAVFRQQFETVEEHNCRTPSEKATYPMAAYNELAAHILHGVLTGATYEEVTEALENRYDDHHLQVAFHSQLKRKAHIVGNPCRSLPPPSTTWLTVPTLDYTNT